MDTSVKWYEDPVYIKMADCPEIQEQIIKRVKDDKGWLRTSAVGPLVNAIARNGEVFTFHLGTWLPMQHQLQAMVAFDDGETVGLIHSFYKFCNTLNMGQFCYDYYTSMEQLWMGFVMKELHGKGWSGTEWVEV